MFAAPKHLNPDGWINLIFSAKAARTGGIVRRSVKWVEREVGLKRFEAEVRQRGFHMVECGGQYIVICGNSALRVIC